MIRSLMAFVSLSLLGGCAYLTTYKSDIGDPATGISIDAKQRVVLVNKINTVRRICAEPSPDALSALGASLGATWGDPAASKQLAAALGETSASIGLRTTSIQLMRDAMYRVCEGFLSDGIDKGEYADLQGNAQNLIIGLLAIEQLTGAVQAQQVSISSSGNAGTGGDTSKETTELFEAKKAVAAQEKLVADAMAGVDVAQAARDQKNTEFESAQNDAGVTDDKKKALEEELVARDKKLEDVTGELSQAEKVLLIEKANESVRQQALDFAKGRAKSATSSRGDFAHQSRGGMSGKDAAVVSQAVTDIVKSVVGTGISFKRCLTLMSKRLDVAPAQMEVLVRLCEEAANDETRRQKSLRQSADVQDFLLRSAEAIESASQRNGGNAGTRRPNAVDRSQLAPHTLLPVPIVPVVPHAPDTRPTQ